MAGNNGEMFTEIMTGIIAKIIYAEKTEFMKLPNGMIIQKIVHDVDINTNKELNITFPITFPNHLICINNFGLCDIGFYVKEHDNSKMKVDVSNFKDKQLQLVVIGY